MNKPTLRTIDSPPQKKSPMIPLAIGVVCFGVVLWTVDHIAGGCLGLDQALTYCNISIK